VNALNVASAERELMVIIDVATGKETQIHRPGLTQCAARVDVHWICYKSATRPGNDPGGSLINAESDDECFCDPFVNPLASSLFCSCHFEGHDP